MLKIIVILISLGIGYAVITYDPVLSELMETPSQEKRVMAGLKVVESTNLYSLQNYMLYTVVELYTESCSACTRLKKNYDRFLPLRPDVAIRRVKLPDNWNVRDASEKYSVDIRSTPHILIFDKYGSLMVEDKGTDKSGYITLQKWIYGTLEG